MKIQHNNRLYQLSFILEYNQLKFLQALEIYLHYFKTYFYKSQIVLALANTVKHWLLFLKPIK